VREPSLAGNADWPSPTEAWAALGESISGRIRRQTGVSYQVCPRKTTRVGRRRSAGLRAHTLAWGSELTDRIKISVKISVDGMHGKVARVGAGDGPDPSGWTELPWQKQGKCVGEGETLGRQPL
jgi:hypothetical protein